MAREAVIFVFNSTTSADERVGAAMIVRKAKEIFEGVDGLRIHLVRDNAADTISYFLKEGELPNGVKAPGENPEEFFPIGEGCFRQGDVISLKGQNYYRACDAYVANLDDGGQSYCVKRVGHPGKEHEDFDGRFREDQ